ncbi:MAG: hypothetical protein MZV70_60720 [Desulfobacterales bacterium]|nr:hypothetical protein [Desulfobacterales bacterium]
MATPLTAWLSDSVPPEVKTISFGAVGVDQSGHLLARFFQGGRGFLAGPVLAGGVVIVVLDRRDHRLS